MPILPAEIAITGNYVFLSSLASRQKHSQVFTTDLISILFGILHLELLAWCVTKVQGFSPAKPDYWMSCNSKLSTFAYPYISSNYTFLSEYGDINHCCQLTLGEFNSLNINFTQ
jgi:hypothetical protein